MKLSDIKAEIQKYQYIQDSRIIDVSLASIIATRLKLGDPVWLILIGPSSGGKSQILRPLSLTDKTFLHRIDDLTENTFLSASAAKGENSLLTRIGAQGMIVISDLTVLFSKNEESKNAIMSQFRMIYDGEMTKHAGNQDKPIFWKGYLGVIAGCTPSIYEHFEKNADMGERFIYWRMTGYDDNIALDTSMNRPIFGKELDDNLGKLYGDYIKEVVKAHEGDIIIPKSVQERIKAISRLAEKIRTPVHMNFHETEITRIPVPAMPMRVALQLVTIAKALSVIRKHETGNADLDENDLSIIDWCGYSLANEEKRACLKILASIEFPLSMSGQGIGDRIGLSTTRTNQILQNLASVGVLIRSGSEHGLTWKISNKTEWDTIRRIENIQDIEDIDDRGLSSDETTELESVAEDLFQKFGE